jgi:FtsP/CotA-like multicopper oxidase with cupredoxin domain
MLKLGACAGVAVALPFKGDFQAADARPLPPLPFLPFQVPLTVPPVARPVRSRPDTDTYQITMRQADVEIIPGIRTRIWGYDGIFPGPTIKARAGKPVVVVQRNELDVDTSVHLHGGIQSPANDGHPTDVIKPRSSKRFYYPNAAPAAPLWYHDHAHGNEARSVYMGLAGLYLVSDELEDSLRLPSGDYDVPLVITDRLFAPNGSLIFINNDHGLGLRRTILVNGRPQPYFQVAARKYRFRLVNASNDRIYELRLSNGREMVQIASDSGLLPRPVAMSSFELSPAERVEVVIDFSAYRPGTRLILHNSAGEDPLTQTIMRFDVVRTAPDESHIPDTLRPLPPAEKPVTERDFIMGRNPRTHEFEINGKVFDPDRVDVRPRLGSTEIWRIHNATSDARHNFHTHLARFRVLDRDGNPPGPGESGFKDTVAVRPGETVRILPRFLEFTGRYVYHCHILAHAHHMMGTMEVVP